MIIYTCSLVLSAACVGDTLAALGMTPQVDAAYAFALPLAVPASVSALRGRFRIVTAVSLSGKGAVGPRSAILLSPLNFEKSVTISLASLDKQWPFRNRRQVAAMKARHLPQSVARAFPGREKK